METLGVNCLLVFLITHDNYLVMATSPSIPIQELCQGLRLENDILMQLMAVFMNDLRLGLDSATEAQSSLLCMPTLITKLPTGKERGQYLALDFSGNEFKVAFIKLKESSFDMRAKQYAISEDLKKGTGTELFDFFAQKIQEFCIIQKLWGTSLLLGFSFGFPYEQRSINSGILLKWTKEFSCSGVVGEDVVVLLEKSLSKIKTLDVKVAAIINSATGVLLSCAWKTRLCRIGCRFDFGINVCYVDKVKNVPKYPGDANDVIVINTECGNFGAANKLSFLQTGWDKELDIDSTSPGNQLFEKMTALMYLSELVRRILVTAVQRNIIVKGRMSRVLATIDAFPAKAIFDILQDTVGQHGARMALKELGYPQPCAQDCVDLEFVCSTVITRALVLMAAAFAALATHLRLKEVVVGIDGTFFHWMSEAADRIREKVSELNPNIKFNYAYADDRGGLGAGLAACMTLGIIAKSAEDIAKEDSFFQTRTFVSAESLGRGPSSRSIVENRSVSLVGKAAEKSSPKPSGGGHTASSGNANSRGKSVDRSRKSGGELRVIKAPPRSSTRYSSRLSTPQDLKQLQAKKKSSNAYELERMKPSGMLRSQSQHHSGQGISNTSSASATSLARRSTHSPRSPNTISASRTRANLTSPRSVSRLTASQQSLIGKVRSRHSISNEASIRSFSRFAASKQSLVGKVRSRHSIPNESSLRRISQGSRISMLRANASHSRRDMHAASKSSISPRSPSSSHFTRSNQSLAKQRSPTTKHTPGPSRTPTGGSLKGSQQSTASLGRSLSRADTRLSRPTIHDTSKMSLSHAGRAQSSPKLVKQDTAKQRPSTAKKSLDTKTTSNASSRSASDLRESRTVAESLVKMYDGTPSLSRINSPTKMKKETHREEAKLSVVHSGRAVSATNIPTTKEQSGQTKQPPAKKSAGSKMAEGKGKPPRQSVGTAATSDSSKQQGSSGGKERKPSTQPASKENQSIHPSEKKTEAGSKKNAGPAKPNPGN